jgi:DNA-binding NarL/FixJ family response regulator
MPAVIDVQNLHKTYGDTVAVDDVSFTVHEGEIFGILGPNGAGKTTTVECIEGLRAPDSGQISVLGLDPRRDRAELTQRLGVQLQDSQLPDQLRVAEALRLNSAFYRHPADWHALMDTLALTSKSMPPGRSRRNARSRRRPSTRSRRRPSTRNRPSALSARKGKLMNPSDAAPIKLLIADDHPVVRDGLSSMFARDPEFEVLGEAADGAEAVRLTQALRPDVVLMDLRMPGMDGVTAITELARRGVAVRVLVLTTYDTDSHVLPAIEAGATGYLLKDAPRDELLRAVRAAAQGDAVLSPSVAARLMNRFRAPGAGPLSQRELEVLEMVAAGTTNREAAARLFISEATVKTHLLNIYAKLGVSDRAAAVAEAFNRGLLTPEAPER